MAYPYIGQMPPDLHRMLEIIETRRDLCFWCARRLAIGSTRRSDMCKEPCSLAPTAQVPVRGPVRVDVAPPRVSP